MADETRCIKILNINVCGIISKLKIDIFKEQCQLYDIICLSETKTDDCDISLLDEAFGEIGYNIICKNRCKLKVKKSGGIIIAYRKGLEQFVTDVQSNSKIVNWVRFNKKMCESEADIVIGAIYIPPRQSPYSKIDLFDELENEILNNNFDEEHVLLCGDFNCHTGVEDDFVVIDRTLKEVGGIDEDNINYLDVKEIIEQSNANVQRMNCDKIRKDVYGNRLLELCKNTSLCIFNGRVGRDKQCGTATTTKNTVIDYFIGHPKLLNTVKDLYVEEFDPIMSDIHKKVVLELRSKSTKTKCAQQSSVTGTKPRLWKKEHSTAFQVNINDTKIDEIVAAINREENIDIDSLVSQVNEILIEAANKTCGSSNAKMNEDQNLKKHKKGFNKECQNKKRNYYKAKNFYRKNNSASNFILLKKRSKEYKQEVNKYVRQKKKDLIKKLRDTKTTNPKVFWNILNSKKNNDIQANLSDLYEHFKSLSKGHNEPQKRETPESIMMDCNHNDTDDTVLNCKITEDEIKKNISKLKNGKAGGVDRIINEYIKNSSDKLMPLYTYLFNKIMDEGKFPSEWKVGMIVPIYKHKGDINDPSNYRGITLLSCLGKLFTSILNMRLNSFLEVNNILSGNQAGFRKNYSTMDHVFLFRGIIELFCRRKLNLFCAFIDYQKAFDTVERDALWMKLTKAGIKEHTKFYSVIKNMYEDIKSCVFANGNRSDYFSNLIGVRQGENLSPVLFSLFVNDLESYLEQNNNAFLNFKDETCNNYLRLMVLMYADDTIIMSNSAEGLQRALDNLQSYCDIWGLNVNSSKTKITIFGNKKTRGNINFNFNKEKLETVDSFKYLGVLFNFNGNFSRCKKMLRDQATKAMFALLNKCRKHTLPVDLQIELFKKTVVPILTYGCEVWGYGCNKILEKVQLKFLKYILCVKTSTPNCMIYGETGCYPIDLHIKTRIVNFWLNIVNGDSSKLCYKLYSALYSHYNIGFKSKWLNYVKSILDNSGMSFVWLTQGRDIKKDYLKSHILISLKDQFKQNWRGELENSNKCITYRSIKETFGYENYLSNLSVTHRTAIIKLRVCNHKLAVERGRYCNIERNNRFCDNCNSNELGDEYHHLFICKNENIVKLRMKYLRKSYYVKPSVYKLKQMMEKISKNNNLAIDLAKFIIESKSI